MITIRQIRAARALIDWSQIELAKRAGIGIATLRRLESSGEEVTGSAKTLWRIQEALEAAGVLFLEQDANHGVGVRLNKRRPRPGSPD
jgi:transcriptional regulator with XRE-family HTH domain